MSKRILAIILALCIISLVGFVGFSVWNSVVSAPTFATGGYMISVENMDVQRLSFTEGASYQLSSGKIKFLASDGEEAVVRQETFLHLDNGSISALVDGILLDFNDLSENFINNYTISSGLAIRMDGNNYSAVTRSGTITFGDHLWKLSDNRYLVQSPKLTVHFSENDRRAVDGYVLVAISDDGVAQLITKENVWLTISEECYIETQSAVRVYPMRQLVDNGVYKMSLAKLSVDADDNIVLTEDETRRQIVPRLNINAEDGADGDDGSQGEAGEEGQGGEAGSDGESGSDGSDGQSGLSGAAGAAGAGGLGGHAGAGGEGGANGAQGADGATGVTGEQGAAGEKGEAGAQGAGGEKGEAGEKGDDGDKGDTGADGNKGSTGNKGTTGIAGNDAVVNSSTNSSLPRMTFTDWQVTTNSLRGQITVSGDDENNYLGAFSGDPSYPFTVTIYNVATGEKISCYDATEGDDIDVSSADVDFESLKAGAESAIFTTVGNPLSPDTEYRISVVAYYKINNEIFSREFLSRNFYTDSAGIFLSELASEQNSVGIHVDAIDSLRSATVYLLTPDQNQTFSLASNSYVYKCVLDYAKGEATFFRADGAVTDMTMTGITRQTDLVLPNLDSNTHYVARVSIETKDAVMLSNQKLDLVTLKKSPYWNTGEVPKVNYNRVTGGFEIYRPTVTDPDGGAIKYTYTAYDKGGNVLMERTLLAGEAEPAVFHLNSAVDYTFGVTMEFNDNKKLVYYDLGRSEETRATGTYLPRLILQNVENNYDSLKGTLVINLNLNSALTVDANHHLDLSIFADQIYYQEISIDNQTGNPIFNNTDNDDIPNYHVVYDPDSSSNQINILLDLQQLYKNTSYIITVTGHIDLGDGNGVQKRVLGSVSFNTTDTSALKVTMSSASEEDAAIALRMSIAHNPDAQPPASEKQVGYDLERLAKGNVSLRLYSGTGFGSTLLASANISDAESLKALYSTQGLLITDALFNTANLNPDASYTLKVNTVADSSYHLGLPYVNYFENIDAQPFTIVAEATPPELLKKPNQGVIATPILNKDAGTYGALVNPQLPDGAIIGYLLEAKFDNSQQLGQELTYYAMEYNDFYGAINHNQNPLDSGNVLMKTTLDITGVNEGMPKVAYLFGGTKSTEGKYTGGVTVYYTGSANVVDTTLASGMDRGFRYVFGYRATYSTSGSTTSGIIKTYPDDHNDFESYRDKYGVGVQAEEGKKEATGVGKTYVLNSGICEAPRVTPRIQSYLHTARATSHGDSSSSGDIIVHYSWANDPDKTITDETVLRWTLSSGDTAQQLLKTGTNTVDENWYSVKVPYSATKADGGLVKIEMDIAQYALDYVPVLQDLYQGTQQGTDYDIFYLCKVPVDYAWGRYFTARSTGNGMPTLQMEQRTGSENRIIFSLVGGDVGVLEQLVERSMMLELTFTTTDDGTPLEKVFYLPISPNSYTATLSSDLLGTEFVKRYFEVTAKLYYDSGDQGWYYANSKLDNPFIALQAAGDMTAPGLSTYLVLSSSGNAATDTFPVGGLLKVGIENFEGKLRELYSGATRHTTMPFRYMYQDVGSNISLYPDRHGTVRTNYNNDIINTTVYTAKNAASVVLNFNNNENDGYLDHITPTMTPPNIAGATTYIRVSDFKVTGYEFTDVEDGGNYKIYMGLFADNASAGALLNPLKTFEFDVVDGVPQLGGDNKHFLITDLDRDTPYYLTFYMKSKGEDVILLDSRTVKPAVYAGRTTDDVVIDAELFQYGNETYFQKNLVIRLNANRNWGLTLRYDFYKSDKDARDDSAVPILSYETLRDNDMLQEPAGLSNSNLTIHLRPTEHRSALVPGGTYYLKITALETDGSPAGYTVMPITIDPIGNLTAYIYVKNSSADEISFQVTINDDQNSLMGHQDYGEGIGLYAVRFVYRENILDSNGKLQDQREVRLVTDYDTKLFTVSELNALFTLSEDHLLYKGSVNNQKIEPKTDYYLQIYAIPDYLHNGQSPDVDALGTKMDSTYFFSLDGNGEPQSNHFHELIDKAWGSDFELLLSEKRTPATDAAIASRYQIAEKMQTTTPDNGVLLNESAATLTRLTINQFQLLLPESFGLIDSYNIHAYKRIDWSISGGTHTNKAVSLSGSCTTPGTLVKQTEDKAAYRYYFDIPATVAKGTYAVVVQFYENESDWAPAYTISRTWYD